MATITIDIKDQDTETRIKNAFKSIHHIPTTRATPDQQPKPQYTDTEWIEKCISTYIKRVIQRHEEQEAKKQITNTINTKDIISVKWI